MHDHTDFFTRIRSRRRHRGGFTLVELLVVIVIFVILTSVVLVSQGNFNDTVVIDNLAYDVALTVRQAQNYGISSKETPLGGFSSYGTYFDIGTSKTNFVLFADTNGNKTYDDGVGGSSVTYCPTNAPECVQKYNLNNGSAISALCVGSSSSTCAAATTLDILFTRPNPDAAIYADGNMVAPQGYARITVSSSGGIEKNIIVTGVGQIYVEQ